MLPRLVLWPRFPAVIRQTARKIHSGNHVAKSVSTAAALGKYLARKVILHNHYSGSGTCSIRLKSIEYVFSN